MSDLDAPASTLTATAGGLGLAPGGGALGSALAAAVMKRIELPSFTAASGSAAAVHIGEIRLENASVDRVDVQHVSTTFSTGAVSLDNARAIVAIRVFFDWWYDVGFSSDSGRETLGTFDFPFDIGNIDIPRLTNISLAVPSASLRDITAAVQPVRNLNLGGATFSALEVDNALLPAAGFGLGGLSLGAVTLTDVRVPGASTARLAVGTFAPDRQLVLPSLRIDGVELPAAAAPRITSQGLIRVPHAVASARTLPGVSFGIFGFTLGIQPTLDIFIDALTIRDLAATATIEHIDLRDVRASVGVSNLELSRVDLRDLHVDRVSL